MYLVKETPKPVRISGIEVGGHPGQYPTLIMAELFTQGDPLVENDEVGKIKKPLADTLIHKTLDTAERTGLQLALTVFGQTPEALCSYVDYFADFENYHGPIVIDAPNHEIRLPAVKHASEIGLTDRVIYDSLHPESPSEEYQALAEYGISSAVLMASNSQNVWPKGRLEVLLDKSDGTPGLIKRAQKVGLDKLFIDSAVMGGAGAILASASVQLIKDTTGRPVGGGMSNIIEYFASQQVQTPKELRKGLLAEGEFGWKNPVKDKPNCLHHVLDAAFDLTALYAGADYLFLIMHGLNEIMPAIAVINAMMGYYFLRVLRGEIKLKQRHPLYHYL